MDDSKREELKARARVEAWDEWSRNIDFPAGTFEGIFARMHFMGGFNAALEAALTPPANLGTRSWGRGVVIDPPHTSGAAEQGNRNPETLLSLPADPREVLAQELRYAGIENVYTSPPADPTDDEREGLVNDVASAMMRIEARQASSTLDDYAWRTEGERWRRHIYEAERLLDEVASPAGFRRSSPATREQVAPQHIAGVIAANLGEQDIYVDGDLDDMVIDTSGTRANLLTVARALSSRFTITPKVDLDAENY